jgi:hypothetical protein
MPTESQAPGLPPIEALGEEPLYHFTRVYLLFCQGLFKQFAEGMYKWSDDDHLTEIVITDQTPIPRDRIEQRPAIITMRGPAQFANMTFDQMRTVDSVTGAKERTDLVSCTMSLNCIAKFGTEAQRIAWLVMRHIRDFRVMLQRTGFHQIGDNISMGPESPPGSIIAGEGDIEAVMVTVFSPFFFQWTEKVTPLYAPLAQNIEAHLWAGLPRFPTGPTEVEKQEVLAALSMPTIRGRLITPQIPERQFPIVQTVKT